MKFLAVVSENLKFVNWILSNIDLIVTRIPERFAFEKKRGPGDS